MSHIRKDILGVMKGLQLVASESLRLQENYAKHIWVNSSIKSLLDDNTSDLKNKFTTTSSESLSKVTREGLQRTSMVFEGIKAFTSYVSNASSAQQPLVQQEEVTLDQVDILEQDILNPNTPFDVSLGFKSDPIVKDVPKESLLEFELNAVISSKGVATQAILKQSSIDKVPPDVRKVIDITPEEKGNVAPISKEDFTHLGPSDYTSHDDVTKQLKSFATGINEKSDKSPDVQTGQVNTKNLSKKFEAPTSASINTNKFKQSLNQSARERRVPASRIARMASFGGLAAGLGLGTIAEAARRTLGIEGSSSNMFVTPANAERIVNTLCKVRGAALKIGQLLSIQDNNVIDPALQKAFERVRQSADFMPHSQVESVLRAELGLDWRSKFMEFEMSPFAAASIGQVHQGRLHDGSYVAVKIQYPGVAKGIDSDIENLVAVMNLWNVFPEGLFVDKIVEVAKKELAWEVDYIREAECTRQFRKLVQPYSDYYVPKVVDDLCTARVLTSELIEGIPVDKCTDLDEKTRERICTLILKICLKELFEWRYMQTDPNWSNFFYNTDSKKLILLDFGATRAYDKAFMDKYINIVKAGADNDRQKVLELSKDMGFLTGFESKAMENAHIDTVMILSEQFRADIGTFDFSCQDATLRVSQLVPTILSHRLCPPPEEIYSLHRKLSGVYLLCAKLKVKLNCRPLFVDVYDNYVFD